MESLKLYRNANPKLGFAFDQSSLNNLYMDEHSLRRLVNHINRQFLVCSNKQSQYLIEGCIDLDNTYITIFCLLIILPIAHSVLFNDYQHIFTEYLLIFSICFAYLLKQFWKGDQMKRKYFEAEEELEQNFMEIQEQFNKRFDYLKMEYRRNYNENQQDYLEIKVTKIPEPIKQLQNRLKRQIELLPIEE